MSGALASMLLSAASACADSEGATPAEESDADIIPVGDSAAQDTGDGGAEGSTSDLPCAVGRLCRVDSPLGFGAVAAINGRSRSDVWASATGGLLLHWDGHAWAQLDSDVNETISSIFLTPEEMFGVAGTLVMRRKLAPESTRLTRAILSQGDTYLRSLSSVAVLPNDTIYVTVAPGYLGASTYYFAELDFTAGTLTYPPDAVHPMTHEAQTSLAAQALFLVPNQALWLVGDHGSVVRYPILEPSDGGATGEDTRLGEGTVLPVASQANLLAAWSHAGQLWAVGWNGALLHFDGARWSADDTGTAATLNAIYGLGPNDIWAAGEGGTVLHFDGARWSAIDLGPHGGSVRAIWGSASDDVWFGGDDGIFHWGALP